MHSSLVRIQNLFGFFTTVGFFVAGLIAVSGFLQATFTRHEPSARVEVRSVQVVKGRAHQYYSTKQNEYAFIKLDLEADLTPLFNWNTKQVFAYLTAHYPGHKTPTLPPSPSAPTKKRLPTPHYPLNEATIWDAIITTPAAAKLSLKRIPAKYNINDITGKFDAQNATLVFSWNVQPHVGALTWGEIRGHVAAVEEGEGGGAWKFTFPMLKARQKKMEEERREREGKRKVRE